MKDFEVLVLEGTNPSGVAMTRDILDAAALFAARHGEAAPRWGMYSLAGGRVSLQGGISVDTTRLPGRRAAHSAVLLIPGLWATSPQALQQRLRAEDCQQAIRVIARHVAAGGRICASCSAVFLLAAAGVLRDRRVTTAWWLAPELARVAPEARVESQRIVCVDGPLITAGAAFAQSDVMLHLLRQRFSSKVAEGTSRVLLLQERSEQAQFVMPALLASGDALVSRLTARVESALPNAPSVAELAAEFCLSERTLSRHVRHATGLSSNDLIQSIRLHRARSLLQNSRLTVEQVAAAVGYHDATALRRLVRKTTGTTPGGLRGHHRRTGPD